MIKHWDEEWYDPSELLLCGIDPGRADDTAIVWMQFYGDREPRNIRWLDSYSKNLQPARYYAHILTGIPPAPDDPQYDFDSEADRIMGWMRSLAWTDAMRVFCDPAGSQKSIADGVSFIDRLMIESKKIRAKAQTTHSGEFGNRRVVPIVPIYEELFSANKHDQTRGPMREAIMRSSWSNTRGAKKHKFAMEQYRFAEPGNKATSQPAPLHDAHSHLVMAGTYIIAYAAMGLGKIKARRDRETTKTTDPYGQVHKTRE